METKMKYGKITIGLICILLALGITWTVTQQAQAVTVASKTFVLPSTSTVTHDANTYLVIWDRATGDLAYSLQGADPNLAGTVAAANDWATTAVITTAQHAQNTAVWTAALPPLDSNYEYVMGVYNNATPADDDVATQGPFLFDPEQGITFSDTNPIRRKNVGVKTQ